MLRSDGGVNHKMLGLLLGPIAFGVYFLLRREYWGAVGAFLVAVVAVPFLRWYLNIEPSPTLNFILGLLVGGITAYAYFYWQEKARAEKN